MKTKITTATFFMIFLFIMESITLKTTSAIHSKMKRDGEFSGIVLKTFANVYITQGEKNNFRTEGNDSKDIIIEIKNDILIVSSKVDAILHKPVSVYVTVKELHYLELAGNGNISITEQLKCVDVEINLSGSGNISANLETKILKSKITGSGDINLKGKSSDSEFEITGSGNLNGQAFKSFSSKITISGSGTGTIDVEDNLVVDITGSGNVYYISEPERIQAMSRGSGRIEKVKA